MNTFMLVIVLLGSSGQHNQLALSGFKELYECQDYKEWFNHHNLIMSGKELYQIQSMECVRQRQT